MYLLENSFISILSLLSQVDCWICHRADPRERIELPEELSVFRCLEFIEFRVCHFLSITTADSKHRSVADLRGARGTRAPPGVQILSILCSFWEIWQNCMLAPPRGVGAPSSGKSWIRHCRCRFFQLLCSQLLQTCQERRWPVGLSSAVTSLAPNFFSFCIQNPICVSFQFNLMVTHQEILTLLFKVRTLSAFCLFHAWFCLEIHNKK